LEDDPRPRPEAGRPSLTSRRISAKVQTSPARTPRSWPNSKPSTNAGPRNYRRPRSTPSTDGCSHPKVIGAPSLAKSWPVDSCSVWHNGSTWPTVNFGDSNTENLRSILDEEMIK
jgi:hypothetical protein